MNFSAFIYFSLSEYKFRMSGILEIMINEYPLLIDLSVSVALLSYFHILFFVFTPPAKANNVHTTIFDACFYAMNRESDYIPERRQNLSTSLSLNFESREDVCFSVCFFHISYINLRKRRSQALLGSHTAASAVTNPLPTFLIFGVYLRKFVLVYMNDTIERKLTSSERSPVLVKEIRNNVIPKQVSFRVSQH